MDIKSRLRNYGFWISVFSFILLALQMFGVHVVQDQYNQLINGLMGILVLAGIINDPTTNNQGYPDDKQIEQAAETQAATVVQTQSEAQPAQVPAPVTTNPTNPSVVMPAAAAVASNHVAPETMAAATTASAQQPPDIPVAQAPVTK